MKCFMDKDFRVIISGYAPPFYLIIPSEIGCWYRACEERKH